MQAEGATWDRKPGHFLPLGAARWNNTRCWKARLHHRRVSRLVGSRRGAGGGADGAIKPI